MGGGGAGSVVVPWGEQDTARRLCRELGDIWGSLPAWGAL